mmetsp:Transcript_23015/g.60110  ORF Transcript_23015/g.60110 Transcript_23015/m.60110 type:complete len:239 (-) Transcript_23015:134-850(-)
MNGGVLRAGRAAAVATWLRHTRQVAHPELGGIDLRLITAECELYRTDARGLPDGWGLPWWGFVWPGGWGVARHLQAHPNTVSGGRKVLDLCAGCGVGAIVALRAGAAAAVANDVCEVACLATEENASLNGVADRLTTVAENVIGTSTVPLARGDLVLVGDALYDAGLAAVLLPWLQQLAADGVEVLLGDPRRWVLMEMEASDRDAIFTPVASYAIPASLAAEHSGITTVDVHRLKPPA